MSTLPLAGVPPRFVGASGAHSAPATFDALYQEHFAFVWRNLRRLGVPSGAQDDAVQDIFLIVHRKLGEFEGRSSFKTWLFGILLRVARRYRQAGRAGPVSPAAPVDPDALVDVRGQSPHERAEQAESLHLLHRLLDALDDAKREVFVLVEIEGLSAPEVAEALGVPVNTVYSRLRLARHEFDQAAARHEARQGRR
jgi:RNA polymerase sigma-70 factor, ECF subfamily